MKVAYVVSMFPCWSETFILNELIQHRKSGLPVAIFSLKRFSEKTVHDEARKYIENTVYGDALLDPRLWISHLCLLFEQPAIYAETLWKLIRFSCSDFKVRVKAFLTFLLAPKFVRRAGEKNISYLHAHFATYPALLAWIVSRFCKIPFSVTAHAHDIYVNIDLLMFVYEDAAAIITISDFNKNFINGNLKNRRDDKIEVIHCGIDTDDFSFVDRKTIRRYPEKKPLQILSVGRLTEIKGFPYLIEALRQLKEEGYFFQCRIIGDGPLQSELDSKINRYGLSKDVFLLGSKPAHEVKELYGKADVFVLPCVRGEKEGQDGIPVVFMEAMARGLPVIGTELSGIPELIRNKATGLCVPPGDATALKEALLYVLNRSSGMEKMMARARKLIEREFNIQKNAKRLRDVFKANLAVADAR